MLGSVISCGISSMPLVSSLPDEEGTYRGGAGGDACGCVQGQAEYFLEKLHGMAEKQVGSFLDGAEQVDGWAKFRENLIGLTDVTRTHFHKLVSVRRVPRARRLKKHGFPIAGVQQAD